MLTGLLIVGICGYNAQREREGESAIVSACACVCVCIRYAARSLAALLRSVEWSVLNASRAFIFRLNWIPEPTATNPQPLSRWRGSLFLARWYICIYRLFQALYISNVLFIYLLLFVVVFFFLAFKLIIIKTITFLFCVLKRETRG